MIINKHFTRELGNVLIGITGLLLVIFIGQSSIKYFKYALNGIFPISYLIDMLYLEIPYLLSLLLPLANYLGIVVVVSRMYADNEIITWLASGVTRRRLLFLVLRFSLYVATLVAIISIWLAPGNNRELHNLRSTAKADVLSSFIIPGQFASFDGGHRVVYTTQLQNNIGQDLFLLGSSKNNKIGVGSFGLITAKTALISSQENGSQQILLQDGYRYSRDSNTQELQKIKFTSYTTDLPDTYRQNRLKENAMPFKQLLDNTGDSNAKAAELHWRLAHPLSVLILSLIAFAISKIPPRAGKFTNIIPAILIYILYYNLLFFGRNSLRQGTIIEFFGLWWVHMALLIVGIIIYNKSFLIKKIRRPSN